jgi:hypothetical protein
MPKLMTEKQSYAGGAIAELKRFKYNNGDAGIADLNAICHTKTLVLEADLSSSTGNGVAIKDGFLCLLFSPENIDTNIGDCLGGDKLEDVLSAAPLPEGVVLPLKARSTIGSVYDKKSKSLLSTLSETLKNPDISFNPNFEENYTKLKAAEESGTQLSSNKWQVNLGSYTLGYLDNIVDNLRRDKFHQDDMFQAAFAEAVTKSEIVLRVVDSLKGSGSSEVVIEDGILYIQVRLDYADAFCFRFSVPRKRLFNG